MKVQEIAKEARESISKYCIEECKAYCCRKGHLILNEEELKLLTGDKQEELENKGFIKIQENNMFALKLGNHLGSCPKLNGSICEIHTNPKRPATCKNFPIFIDEEKKEIKLASRCFAVKENKLYPYIHQFLELGFKIK
jgi:Fe-S-cluster containining protein